MTDREEFDDRRRHGLRRRHARRLLHANTPDCSGCDASSAACETLRWLAGRTCCTDCTHTTAEAS